MGYKSVRVHSPDSDVFFILLYYAHMLNGITVWFDTGTGNHRRLINITETAKCYSDEYVAALLALHAFCGCDTTSALKGKGHVGPIKLLKKFPKFIRPLSQIGNDWIIAESLIDELEEFTCAVYGQYKFASVDELRHFKIKQKCDGETDATKNVDLAALPPCKKSVNPTYT